MNNDLIFREAYWSNKARRLAFKRFLSQVFGLDLSLWESWGFWDDNYRPFSFFDGEKVVANVCVYTMDMVIAGERKLVAQISAVGTVPEYRRRGLAMELMQKALAWADERYDLAYLFADDVAFSLYQKCGFRPVVEQRARVRMAATEPRPGAENVRMDRPREGKLIASISARRAPVSEKLGTLNQKLFMFWCLYGARDYIHFIRDLELLVLYTRAGGVLKVLDIVGEKVPPFADIYPYIAAGEDEVVEFSFMPDRLSPGDWRDSGDVEYVPVSGNGTHIRGEWPIAGEPFVFPVTAQA